MNVCRPFLRPLVFLASVAFASLAFANTAIEPVPRSESWLKRHEGFVEIAHQGHIDVLFLGDSITDFWRNSGKPPRTGGKAVWDANFAPLHAANFGISADRTQHLLWRIEHGELEGISPRAIVLMIGTNNIGFESDGTTPRNTPAEAAEGVAAIVHTLRTKLPDAQILLLAIFPRSKKPDDPKRLQVAEINRLIAPLGKDAHVHYLDIGQKFLSADGTLSKNIMPDFLHPNEHGYEIWAAAIKEPLAALLR
ncbi:platelet-activating factor acetylhydrolase IB subunit [Horticoccus luteus]|uniref:platelet-activating factor acetylhydrolase IB subunit n=1 Tax=Horticoccus luteus TaxID=2862869 RepID=UPI0021050690|nr:platelet-activating factor acetylhydrolase IB subunit [Horticoccus luteus]